MPTGCRPLQMDQRRQRAAGRAMSVFLHQLASLISKMVRSTDVIGRLGSNKFVLILPGADAAKSIEIAEALRVAVPNLVHRDFDLNPITASVGVSSMKESGSRIEDLISHADLALFLAKSEGRNRQELYQPEDLCRLPRTRIWSVPWSGPWRITRSSPSTSPRSIFPPTGWWGLKHWRAGSTRPSDSFHRTSSFRARKLPGSLGLSARSFLTLRAANCARWQRAGHTDRLEYVGQCLRRPSSSSRVLLKWFRKPCREMESCRRN